MIALGPHAAFIWAAYGTTILLVGALIAWIVREGRVQRRLLEELEARGMGRRSARAREAGADEGPRGRDDGASQEGQ